MELHILKNPKYKEILLSSKYESILFKNSSHRTTHNHRGTHDGYIEDYGIRISEDEKNNYLLGGRQKKPTKNFKMILHSNDIREIYIVKSQSKDKDNYLPIIYTQTIHGKRRLDFSPTCLYSAISNVSLRDWDQKKIDTDNNKYIKLKRVRFDVIDNKIKRVHVYK